MLPQLYLDSLKIEDRRRIWYGNLARLELASFLIESGGQVAGFVNLWPCQKDASAMEITSLYVDPDHWGRGLGSKLMERAIDCVVDRGHRRVRLWVLADNVGARAFYERCGFRHEGVGRQERSFGGLRVRELQYGLAVTESRAAYPGRGLQND